MTHEQAMRNEIWVRRNGAYWTVSEETHDGTANAAGKSLPRVTVILVYKRHSEALDAARSLAGDATWYEDEAPVPADRISAEDKAKFWA